MRLADRLGQTEGKSAKQAGEYEESGFTADSREDMASIAQRLHQKILDRLDLAAVSQLSQEELRSRLRTIVEQLVHQENIAMSAAEQVALVEQVLDELTGHGPLESLLHDPSVSDVLVNGFDQVYIEQHGKLVLTDIRFRDDRHLIHTIQRMVARIGRRIDESSPMVDARLPDGSRVNAIIPPLAIDGPALSIRRFSATNLMGEDLVRMSALSQDMLNYLHLAVRARCSILISGGTGAGKTTLLNMLSGFISKRERVITIEDAAELRLQKPHVVRLESRPPNLEGKGEVTIRDLVKNALRMRPDRIIVGEVRSGEVLDMLQAMNTGHDGSMATIHANSPEDSMSRLMTMLGMTGTVLAEETMTTMIARAVHIVLQVTRMQDGKRRITGISEVIGYTGSQIHLQSLFAYERTGTTSDGGIIGRHMQKASTTLNDRFRQAGVYKGAASGEIIHMISTVTNLIFFVVLAAFGAVGLLLYARSARTASELRRRLGELKANADEDLIRQAEEEAGAGSMAQLVAESGLGWSMGMFLTRLLLAGVIGLTLGILVKSALLAVTFALTGMIILWAVVRAARARRLVKCDEQMPQALEIMSLALRAGHALPKALSLAADEAPAPLCYELRRAADEHALGRPISEVLESLSLRLPTCEAVSTFVVAVLVLQETGGNLIPVIDRIVENARARASYRARLRALTSEGRQSAKLLALIPGAFAILAMLSDPGYADMLFYDPGGRVITIIAGLLWLGGILWTRRLVRPVV